MLSLLLPAKFIPDGTEVRKPTGQVKYNLVRQLTVHYDKAPDKKQVIHTEGVIYLLGDTSACGYPDDRVFAVDFKSPREIVDFCDEHLISHQ